MQKFTLFFLLTLVSVSLSYAQDSDTLGHWANLKREFKHTKNDSLFCKLHSAHPYSIDIITSPYYLDANLYDSLEHIKIGDVVGPFASNTWLNESEDIEKDAFILKLKKIDSCYEIRVSHILFNGSSLPERTKARHISDSLIQLIQAGTPFEKLAHKYGHDGTEQLGGDLGWFKQKSMVKAFDTACFNSKKGDLFKVETPFGLHLVTTTENKRLTPCQYEIVSVVKITNKKK